MLTWKLEDLVPLVEHAKASKEHRQTYAEQIDGTEPQPALHFVKDQGVYLMSNGLPSMPNPHGSGCQVVYAAGHDPEKNPDWWDDGRRECGGDDFVEAIPLADIERGIRQGCAAFRLKLTQTHMETRCTGRRRKR